MIFYRKTQFCATPTDQFHIKIITIPAIAKTFIEIKCFFNLSLTM